MIHVETFSKGKVEEKNEDYFGHNDTAFIVADGATDKSGKLYDGKTGGEIASRLVVETCLSSNENGAELVRLLNGKISDIYKKLGIEDLANGSPLYRFTSGFVLVRKIESLLFVTAVGDVGFRVNGQEVFQKISPLDGQAAEKRAEYIRETGDIQIARERVVPFIIEQQIKHQNNPDTDFGYGIVDGTATPDKLVRTFTFNAVDIKTIELFSDGYFGIPKGTAISDWEEIYEQIEKEDPDKFKTYKSTKSKDDRTIMIINFD